MSDGADEDDEPFDWRSVGPEIPWVDVPGPGEPDLEDADVDSGTVRLFWRLVVVFDVAVFALAAGPALWFLGGRRALGVQVTALGVVTFGYGVYRLRTRERGAGGATDGNDDAHGEGDGDGPADEDA